MNAFAWLNDLVQAGLRFFPRLTIVPPTHAGVRFGPRGGASNAGAGAVLWWPLVHRLVQVPTAIQSIQLAARCLLHEGDDRLVPRVSLVSLAAQYRVVDPVLAATRVVGLRALVDNRSKAAVAGYFCGLGRVQDAVDRATEELRSWMPTEYGVVIERLDVVNASVAVAVVTFRDWAYVDAGEGDG